MGRMSAFSGPRKDLAASFNRLKRMVDDVKSARKSLAAHHSFMAELVSVSLSSSVPSSKASSPGSPPYHPHLDESQEVGCRSAPSSKKIATSGPRSLPCKLQLDDLQEVGIGSPILQVDDSQEVGIRSLILQGSIPCSLLSTANSNLSSHTLLVSRIFALPTPSPSPSVWSGHDQASYTCRILKQPDCSSNKILMPLCHAIAANPGKLAGQPAFWASLLFAFLCFFLCLGKEVAVGVTITAYFIIWLTFKGLSFSKQILRNMFRSRFTELHLQDKQSERLNRSSTILTHGNDILLSSSESHFCTRSQYLPPLHECAQEEVFTSEPSLSDYSPPSLTAVVCVGTHSARFKLGIMLVLALCGLAHGQIMAVSLCSCCILMFSEMQRLALKRCKQEIQDNI